jgi:hypothetical protein
MWSLALPCVEESTRHKIAPSASEHIARYTKWGGRKPGICCAQLRNSSIWLQAVRWGYGGVGYRGGNTTVYWANKSLPFGGRIHSIFLIGTNSFRVVGVAQSV